MPRGEAGVVGALAAARHAAPARGRPRSSSDRCSRVATTTAPTTRTARCTASRGSPARWSAGIPTPTCRRSSRGRTPATSIGRIGTASSSTRRSGSAASTIARISWSPGELTFALGDGDAVWLLAPARAGAIADAGDDVVAATAARLEAERIRRAAFPSRLARAADAYVVARGTGRTIVAGYPWFTDWGRDTFIALRGLCLATGRVDAARAILLEWCGVVSEGMLPNRFPDGGTRAGIQRRRRLVVVRRRRGRAARRRARPVRSDVDAADRAALLHGGRGDRRGPPPRHALSASAPTRTACSPAARRASSSRGWTPRSATAW